MQNEILSAATVPTYLYQYSQNERRKQIFYGSVLATPEIVYNKQRTRQTNKPINKVEWKKMAIV